MHAHLILVAAVGLKRSYPTLIFKGHRGVLCVTTNAAFKLLAGTHDLQDNMSEVVPKCRKRPLVIGKTCSATAIATVVSPKTEQQIMGGLRIAKLPGKCKSLVKHTSVANIC